jgi:predicted alpha/beta-hydrolase family hydrolase
VIRAAHTDPNLSPQQLYLAGKNLGGRVDSQVAAQGEPCEGLVFLGYPLHPPKRIDQLRVGHWPKLSCPVLFVQGTRDALCDLEVLKAQLPLIAAPVTLQIVEGGDHSFKVPRSTGKDQQDVWRDMSVAILSWLTKTRHGAS